MRKPLLPLFVFSATIALATACGGGGSYNSSTGNSSGTPTSPNTPTSPPANTVLATPSITFDPSTLTVSKGTTVTFTFQSVGHNVFFDAVNGAPADIPQVTANSDVARTFSTVGTFTYSCHVHPGMRGSVIVQ